MKTLKLISALALATALAACNADGLGGGSGVPTPPPAPPPPPTGTAFNVDRCLNQSINGRKLIDIMIPDMVVLDLSQPAGFPNGRKLDDPVIDIFLAGLFLDQARHTPYTLVNIPLNSNFFDQPLRTSFPYFAPSLGHPVLSQTNGSNFNFRTEPSSQFVRVERVASPAVSTVNILSPRKNAYNDGDPSLDVAGNYRNDVSAGLANLTALIADDLTALGLTICATPI